MTQISSSSLQRLQGRRILITGAASGIGRATALLFAAEGAQLTLLDRDVHGLAEVAASIGAHYFETDVSDEQSVGRAVQEGAIAMGGIDGVVNAAGVLLKASVHEASVTDFKRVIDVNVTGIYIVVKACLPWLEKAQDPTIVNLGSAQSLLPNAPNRTAYSTSKGAVLNLSRALAAELAPAIRVNSVCPGLIETPMTQEILGNTGNYALRRLGQPEEVAYAVLFLTSRESTYVTGAALAVDGGRSFH